MGVALPPDHGEAVVAGKVCCPWQCGDGLLSSIDQVGIDLFLRWEGAQAQNAVLGLKVDCHAIGNEI